jgi:hypothetical protein
MNLLWDNVGEKENFPANFASSHPQQKFKEKYRLSYGSG